MEHAPECTFDSSRFPIASNKLSPFNSQNTFFKSTILPDYFMFPFVGRMDDIWAAYYVQAKNFKVVYGAASVYQKRNAHDLTQDMRKEYAGYENNLKMVNDLAKNAEAIKSYLPENTMKAWDLYRRHFK